jgi:hypothetical protein
MTMVNRSGFGGGDNPGGRRVHMADVYDASAENERRSSSGDRPRNAGGYARVGFSSSVNIIHDDRGE